MSYPFVSNLLFERNASKVIAAQEGVVATRTAEELAQELAEAHAYNENLAGDPLHDPFVPGSGYALPANYTEVLNLAGDGIMGSIEIPKISVTLPIYHGTGEDVLAHGVGHIEQTALPVGGEGTNAVLTGHRGLPSAELFSRLDELDVGDEFYVHVLDQILAYRVDRITTVLPDELSEVRAVSGKDWVTLVTCTPYGVNTHRLIVRGERCEYHPGDEQAKEQAPWRLSPYEAGLFAGSAIVAASGALLVVRSRVKGPRGRHARRG